MRRRGTLVVTTAIAVLALLLLGGSLGGARTSSERAIVANLPATASSERAELRASERARHRHGPAVARKRAVHGRRGGFVRTPKGGRSAAAEPPPVVVPAAPDQPPSSTSPAAPSVPVTGAPEPPGPTPLAPVPPVAEPPAPSAPTPSPPEPAPQNPVAPTPTTPTPPRPPVVGPAEPVPPRTQQPQPVLPPLFLGDQISDFDAIEAAPDAVAEVRDPLGSAETVFRMTVDEGDVAPITPTDNPRAQALSPSLINPGEEFWLATKFLLPNDFPTVPGWLSLVSIYGPPFAGSSPWQIGVHEDEFTWERNGTYGYDVPWRMPAIKGRWVELLLHERFAADGWVEMWIDGQPVTFFPDSERSTGRLAMETMDASNGGGPNAAKIMLYREAGMFESATVYFGALRLGETRGSVGG